MRSESAYRSDNITTIRNLQEENALKGVLDLEETLLVANPLGEAAHHLQVAILLVTLSTGRLCSTVLFKKEKLDLPMA
jgi:hypothetical protein